MPFIEDTFTDADGTLLENHSPDIGLSWVKKGADVSSEIQNDELTEGNDVVYENEIDPPTADYDAKVDTVSKENDYYNHLLYLRWDDVNQDGYAFSYRRDTLRFQVRRIDNGFETILAESSQVYRDNFPWTHKCQVEGTTLTQWEDDGNTKVNEVTDSTHTAKGKFAFQHGVCSLDNLEVNDLGSPGTVDDYADITQVSTPVLSSQGTTEASESATPVEVTGSNLTTTGTTTATDSAHPSTGTVSSIPTQDSTGIDDSANILSVGTTSLVSSEYQSTTEQALITGQALSMLTASGPTTGTESPVIVASPVVMLTTRGNNVFPKFEEQRSTPALGTGIVEVD
jgi:hypothetical protein